MRATKKPKAVEVPPCDLCGATQDVLGAILYGPPEPEPKHGRTMSEKSHVCISCYDDITEVVAPAMAAQRLDMLVDLVDSNDRVIGTVRRRQALRQQAGFRVAHVFLFNAAGDLLLQQIAPGLRHPGQWGSSVAGYLKAGESYHSAATRKLQEELGVATSVVEHGKTSMVDQSTLKFIDLFVGSYEGPFYPDPAEASALEFVSMRQILAERAIGTRPFTDTFLHLLDFYLRSSSIGP